MGQSEGSAEKEIGTLMPSVAMGQDYIYKLTSSVSRDSKKLCEVRKWPMSFAEAAEIQKWARTMWRHAPAIRDDE